MRKIVGALFITIDGVVEAPHVWSFDHFDEGMEVALQAAIDAQDTVLLGRVTYDEWVGYWPTATDEPFASYINNVPKYVVSNTLDKVEWNNTHLIKGDDFVQTLTQLKQQPGKNIGTAGSPTLLKWLVQHDLLDELVLTVYPVVAGKGKHLFDSSVDLKRMKLVSSSTTPTGVAILTYQPRSE